MKPGTDNTARVRAGDGPAMVRAADWKGRA
jgi:hypothetical protein